MDGIKKAVEVTKCSYSSKLTDGFTLIKICLLKFVDFEAKTPSYTDRGCGSHLTRVESRLVHDYMKGHDDMGGLETWVPLVLYDFKFTLFIACPSSDYYLHAKCVHKSECF